MSACSEAHALAEAAREPVIQACRLVAAANERDERGAEALAILLLRHWLKAWDEALRLAEEEHSRCEP